MELSCGPAAAAAVPVAAGAGELAAAGDEPTVAAGDELAVTGGAETTSARLWFQPDTPKRTPAIPAIASTLIPRGPTLTPL
jgi:hypothetical protein